MNRSPHLGVGPSALAALSALFLAACQTYDFEPVLPLAIFSVETEKEVIGRTFKPNIMLVVDKSGSMRGLTAGSGSATRWAALKSAMGSFLPDNEVAQFGLTFFPEKGLGSPPPAGSVEDCKGPESARRDIIETNDDPAQLRSAANAVNSIIQGIGEDLSGDPTSNIGGGTPASKAIVFAGGLPALQTKIREDFLLLLTDGAPNCNENADHNTCTCTGSSCTDATRFLCLDAAGTVAQITNIRNQFGIRTIVVGFGADTASGYARDTLNLMAEAGGFARRCPNCGTSGCDPGGQFCNDRYYQAQDQTTLQTTLSEVAAGVGGDLCIQQLSAAPSDNEYISVLWTEDGTTESLDAGPDTWNYGSDSQSRPIVTFTGSRCDRLHNASPDDPIKLTFRVVGAL